MNVLAIDVGGTHVKILATEQKEPENFVSGPKMTAKHMVATVKKLAAGWSYDVVSIGYPGPVLHGHILHEPHNLGLGWVKFDFKKAFGRPVKIINDAAMQALGSYKGGSMLFLGLGTGLGSAMIVNGLIEPMELRLINDYSVVPSERTIDAPSPWARSAATAVQQFDEASHLAVRVSRFSRVCPTGIVAARAAPHDDRRTPVDATT